MTSVASSRSNPRGNNFLLPNYSNCNVARWSVIQSVWINWNRFMLAQRSSLAEKTGQVVSSMGLTSVLRILGKKRQGGCCGGLVGAGGSCRGPFGLPGLLNQCHHRERLGMPKKIEGITRVLASAVNMRLSNSKRQRQVGYGGLFAGSSGFRRKS